MSYLRVNEKNEDIGNNYPSELVISIGTPFEKRRTTEIEGLLVPTQCL